MKGTFQAADPKPIEVNRVRRARQHPRPGRLLSVSLLLAISWLGVALFFSGGFMLWRFGDSVHGWLALGGLLLFAFGRGTGFVLGQHVNCPLCHGPVLHEKRCHKHAEAFRIAPLSYRSSAVVSLLGTGTFRCMYCGTPYRLKK